MIVNVTKISQKMQKKLVEYRKNIIKEEKTSFIITKKLILKNNDSESYFVFWKLLWSYKFTSEKTKENCKLKKL